MIDVGCWMLELKQDIRNKPYAATAHPQICLRFTRLRSSNDDEHVPQLQAGNGLDGINRIVHKVNCVLRFRDGITYAG